MEKRADTADRADDLIPEESELVQRALKRLSPKESYDRVFRMRRAFQVHLHGETLQTVRTCLTGYTVLARSPALAQDRMDQA